MTAESLIRTKGIRCNVQRAATSQDASGSVLLTWAGHLTSIPIFIQPATGDETVRYGRENDRITHTGYTLTTYDINPTDRLTGGNLGSRVMDIQSVIKAGEFDSGPLAHQVLVLEETEP